MSFARGVKGCSVLKPTLSVQALADHRFQGQVGFFSPSPYWKAEGVFFAYLALARLILGSNRFPYLVRAVWVCKIGDSLRIAPS